MNKSNTSPIGHSWEEVEAEIFTPEEISQSDIRVALIGELIKARTDKGISQKKLEELSGVRQPIIARMEKGSSTPNLSTVIKVLAPLGKSLAIVDLKRK
ncbi:putative HTH-type transcriptional regulator [Clostridia bacterium]|nr:putative HTH-type transcriptional regulator [Clostridia bacterium]